MHNYKPLQNILDFLEANKSKKIRFQPPDGVSFEIEEIELVAPDSLEEGIFPIDTFDYFLNLGEEGKDPGLRYEIKGIDLVRNCEGYTPSGVLVYFPDLREFGAWDPDHLVIWVFPGASWSDIEAKLGCYINAQWYPDLVDIRLLKPWIDPRCTDLIPTRAE